MSATRTIAIGLAALAALGWGQAARAEGDGWERCVNDRKIPAADRIAGCTRVIDSGVWDGENLGLAHALRGLAKGQSEDHVGALTDLDDAIALRPTDTEALMTRAAVYAALKRPNEQLVDFDRVLVLRPRSSEALNARCWTLAELNRELDKALADCNAALKIIPDSSAFLDSRGLVHLRAGRWDAAIADYTAALEGAPKQPWSLYGRGIAKVRKGDRKGGKADIEAGKASWAGIEAAFNGYDIKP